MLKYQHSGIVPFAGALQALAIATAASVVLGIVYSFTFYYIPLIYLNFLLAVAFGVGTGWVVAWAAREGKIRNTAATVAIAVVASLAGIYAEWGSTLYALTPPGDLPAAWKAAGLASFLPHYIAGLMLDLFENGSWGLSANHMVTGWTLVSLWFVEAGTIIGLAATTAYTQIAKRPFCEGCQEWIVAAVPHLYQGGATDRVWSDVQHGNFDTLADTPRATGREPTYVRLKLHVCDTCAASNFLTITECRNTHDHRGNPKLIEKDVVTNLVLEPTHVDLIQAANTIAPTVEEAQLQGAAAGGNWTMRS